MDTNKTITISETVADLLLNIQEDLTELRSVSAAVSKQYLSPHDVERDYRIKRSLQAKLRMDKKYGPPYVRPSGARIVLYNKEEFEKWLEEWRVS